MLDVLKPRHMPFCCLVDENNRIFYKGGVSITLFHRIAIRLNYLEVKSEKPTLTHSKTFIAEDPMTKELALVCSGLQHK